MLAKNLPINDLIAGTQISRENLRNYLAGRFEPSLPHATKIAEFCGCSLDYLLGLIDNPQYGDYAPADLLFYEHYQNFIKVRGLSHYRVAKDLNLSLNVYRNWRDGAMPNLKVFTTLCKYLGVTADSLVGRTKVQ